MPNFFRSLIEYIGDYFRIIRIDLWPNAIVGLVFAMFVAYSIGVIVGLRG